MAHQQTEAARSYGQIVRQHSQHSRANKPTGPSISTVSPTSAFQVDIDKLSKGLGSVDLKSNSRSQNTSTRISLSIKTSGTTIVKPTNKAKAAGGGSPTESVSLHEPSIVRRSRRGEKAISHHPQLGRYRIELTSSERLWCGKFALGISTEQQLGTRLTVEDFDEIFAGEESRAFNKKHGWVDVEGTASNFYDEQLDLVLRVWGRRHGQRLRLGVLRDFEGLFVNNASDDEDTVEHENCTTVWIHNDNAMLLGRPFNHYSGITVLEKV